MSTDSQGPATQGMTGKAMTVTGPVDPVALGMTVMHEHIFSSTSPGG